MRLKIFITTILLLVLLVLTGCDLIGKKEEGPVKVGLLLMSSPDESYSEGYQGYMALKSLERKYGVDIAYNENVRNIDNAGYLLNSYGKKGYDLVIAVGDMFMAPMHDAAASYQDTEFVCINGTESSGNMTSYDLPDGDIAYLAGSMAALMAANNNVAYLLSEDAASYLDDFKRGVAVIKSEASVEEIRVNSAIGYSGIIGYMNNKGIKGAGLFLNSVEFETMLEDNGILCSVVGGLAGTDEARPPWPRIGFDYDLIFNIVYSDYLNGGLAGKTIEIGFQDKVVFIESLDGLSDEYKGKIEDLARKLK